MDQLFTLYNAKAANRAVVTTANSTLTWQYVASGLPDGSGGAGLAASGPYPERLYVQLDGNGGGVVAAGADSRAEHTDAAGCRSGRPAGLRLAKAEIAAATSVSRWRSNKMG